MIYLKQSFDLHPASPASRDRFVETLEKRALASSEQLGGRLVGAWFCNEEWFSQIVHVTEFDDLAAFGAWRDALASQPEMSHAVDELAALAPVQRTELLEPLGPIAPSALDDAIAAACDEPAGAYTFAILEVEAGKLDGFAAMIDAAKAGLPIIACWRDVVGNRNRIIDLWKGDMGRAGYRPTNDAQDAFFEPLRKLAPREKMVRLHPLPYSPLQ